MVKRLFHALISRSKFKVLITLILLSFFAPLGYSYHGGSSFSTFWSLGIPGIYVYSPPYFAPYRAAYYPAGINSPDLMRSIAMQGEAKRVAWLEAKAQPQPEPPKAPIPEHNLEAPEITLEKNPEI